MTDLTIQSHRVADGKSALVITRLLADLPGGVPLDMSLLPGVTSLSAGHVILSEGGKYYAAPVTGSAYAAFGSKKPVGVLVADVLPATNLAAVMTVGQVRSAAAPYPYTDAVKSALPRIDFL